MISLLYIDDEPGLLELGQLFLESDGGFRVITALSGAEGLKHLASQEFDAIVSDYQMPEMNGLELLKNVRKSFGNIPFILFTGRGREEVVIEAINIGVDFYLQKGGDPKAQFAELSHKVRQAVNRRRAETALSDSERRLADIINFLPDATFAIDTRGVVIAWSRAMETMTGVRSEDVLGKGDYEYALPFYHERRPLLINLVLDDNPAIEEKYPFVKREGKTLFSEITIPHFNEGKGAELWFTASPLYDRKGEMAGAIESIREITDRKRAETALSDSERRLADIINFLPDATFAIDTRGTVIAWNRAMEQMTGVRSEDVLGKGNYAYALPFYHERRPLLINLVLDDDPAIAEKYPFVKREGKTLFSEITIPHFNEGKGAALWFTASPLYDRKGEMVGAIESIREITDRKRAEDDLVSANREYTNLLDQIQDIYYRSDNEGRLVRASRSWATLFGYDDLSECIGMSVADDFYVNPSDRNRLLEEIRQNGKVTGYQVLLKKKDGTPVLIEASSHLYFDPAGNVIGVEGTFRDITDRKKGEKALNESERRFREMAELLPQGIYEADTSGRIVYINRVALEMSGYTREDILNGFNALLAIAPEDRQRAAAVFRQIVEQGTRSQASAEYKGIRKDGTTFPVSIYSSPILKDTKTIGVRGILVDITERKKVEDELRAANEQLVASDEELQAQYQELALSEKRIRMSETRLTFMLGFYEYARKSEKELLAYAIEGAGIVTGSPLGYLAFLNGDESELSMYAWSKNAMAECSMTEKPIIYKTEKTGLWGEAVRQRQPVITNDYNAPNPAKKGYPKGHPHIIRHMNIPVIDDGHIVLVAGVANKPADYTENDTSELILLMQALWAILKRRRAEETRLESEAKYRTLFETADEGIWTIDAEFRTLSANRKMQEMFGYTGQEMMGRPVWDFVPPGDAESVKQELFKRPRGVPGRYERRWVRKDGTVIWCFTSATPLFSPEGTFIGSFGMFTDITERRQMEEALRESEEKFRAVIDQSFEFIGLMTPDGILIEANRAALALIDIAESEVLNRPFWETPWWSHSPELREKLRNAIHRAASGEIVRFEASHPTGNGHVITVDFSVKPVVDSQGRIQYLIPEGRDITERKRAEDELRLTKISQDRSSDEVFWMDFAGNILYVNDAACRITGYSREELLRMKLFGLDPAFPPEVWEASVADLRQRKTQFITTRHRRKDGVMIDVEIVTVYVNQDDREYSFAYVREVTERKRTEDALRESEEKYRTLVESSFDGIAIHQDGILVFANLTAARILGSDNPDDFIGKPAIDIVAPAFREQISPRVERGAILSQELIREQFLRADGTTVDVDVTTTPSTWNGRPAAYVTFRDITAQVQAEEASRESEEKYRTLVEVSHDIIYTMTTGGIILYASPQVIPQLGYRPEEMEGKEFMGFIHPDDAMLLLGHIREHFDAGKPVRPDRFRVRRKDGGYRWFEDTTIYATDREGRQIVAGTIRDVTEEKAAQDALRESEEKYRMLVEQSRDGVFIIQDGRLVFYNKALTSLSGYSAEELDGRLLADLVAPEDQEMVISRARDRILGGEVPDQYEFSLLHKDKNRRIRVRVSAGQGSYKGRPASIGTFYDVTEDRRREGALRESEEKFRALVETTSDFIWEVDTAGKYTYVSPQVHQILGYEPGELIGSTPFDLMPAEEGERVAAEFNLCITSRLPITGLENKALRKDGSVVILETSGIVRTAEDGRYLGYRGIDRDITKRKEAEQALHDKTEELNRFFTTTLDLFCIAGTDGFFRRLNPEWEKALGYSLEELEGHRFLDFVHPDDYPSTLAAVADLAAQKAVINFTNRYRHKDGTYRWIEWRSLPVGALIFAAARDITARHDAAERTEQISALKQDLLRTAPLEEKMKRITDGIVDIFGADFARIWIAGPGDLCSRGCIHAAMANGAHACKDRTSCLHLIVSSGRYSHTDGGHRRVPFGAYKIGRIATGDEAMFITNDVTHDPRVHDHAWAESLGLKSFAGFRLVSPEGTPVGVLAFFSRQSVLPEVMEDLSDLATTASQVIQTGMVEQALRESEARLSSILQGSPVLQFVIDSNHRVISWNAALEEYSGIRAADIIGTDLQWRAFYPKKRPVLADLLVDGNTDAVNKWYTGKFWKSRYIEGAIEATDFFPRMGSSGTWLSFTAAPIRDAGGRIIGAVESLEDITERMNAENALRESEERARTILNTAQAGIILVDAAAHEIIDANNKALELIGLPRESVIGSVCHRFICPAEEGKCPVTDSGQQVDTSERVLIAADGSQIPVLKTVVPVTLADRNILVESFVDISGHKRSEAAIREANRKLNLLSSITRHDVANQLTAVQGYTQLAGLQKPGPAVADYLGRIASAVETIQHQIEFTKEYQELGVHAPGWFGVGDMIRGAKPKKVRLRCTCDPFEVFADPMIGRVFFNLFDNAIRYGGKVTTITAGCKTGGNDLVITFSDNGVGIPPGEKEKIFEKGYGQNTGFGLFLAREILAITGIAIHETGKQGKGARFEIIVPKGAFRNKE